MSDTCFANAPREVNQLLSNDLMEEIYIRGLLEPLQCASTLEKKRKKETLTSSKDPNLAHEVA